jgi:hypothetical protein
MILQRFRLSSHPNSTIDRKGLITLAPKYGMPMLLSAPDRRFVKMPVRGAIHEMAIFPDKLRPYAQRSATALGGFHYFPLPAARLLITPNW